jgi:mono/diheme cytochrome c family protein
VKQIIPVALTLLASSAGAWAAGAAPTAEQFAFFEKHVRSVLAESCFKCHGPEKQKHGLRLDSREALLRGGDDGPILTPENPEASPLVRALRREGDNPMPPKEKLPPGQAELLVQWVKMGAPYPASAGVAKDKLPDPAKHWAFQPVRKPA